MSAVTWSRLAAVAGGLVVVALTVIGPSASPADVAEEQVDLSLSSGGRPFTNSVGMTFVFVGKGTFQMGSPKDEKDRQDNEQQHKVEITKGFYLATTELTQKQYQTIMGNNPSYYCKTGAGADAVQGLDTSDFPVETVSHQDATAFVAKLDARDRRKSGWKYVLPTEAQWEYACRGGPDSTTKPIRFAKPQDSLSVSEANFSDPPYNGGKAGQPLNRTCKVGSYKPNNLGLYDMHGNVWEWCADWYAKDYGGTTFRDPTGPREGSQHLIKSGALFIEGWQCRAARRADYSSTSNGIGFRVAFVQVH